jgi:hypothetical protein
VRRCTLPLLCFRSTALPQHLSRDVHASRLMSQMPLRSVHSKRASADYIDTRGWQGAAVLHDDHECGNVDAIELLPLLPLTVFLHCRSGFPLTHLPFIQQVPSFLANGDYKVHAEVSDSTR